MSERSRRSRQPGHNRARKAAQGLLILLLLAGAVVAGEPDAESAVCQPISNFGCCLSRSFLLQEWAGCLCSFARAPITAAQKFHSAFRNV